MNQLRYGPLFGLLVGLLSISAVHCSSREVFGFTNFVAEAVYKQYDLSKISSLVFLDSAINDQFLEYARSKNVQTYLTSKYASYFGFSNFEVEKSRISKRQT